MKHFFVLLVLPILCFGYSNNDIAEALKQVAHENNIDKRIVYTIAKIETNFTPLIIAFVSKQKNWEFQNSTTKVYKYKDKYIVNIQANKEQLSKIARILINKGINIDIGLMQINSVNFTNNEIPYMLDLEYNIQKSINVITSCRNTFSDIKRTIECYNKGTKLNANMNYYSKFKNSFNKDFGNLY